MKDIYVEVLNSKGYSIVQLGKLGGQKISLRSYSGKEAGHDAQRFASEISELLDCPLMNTEERWYQEVKDSQ